MSEKLLENSEERTDFEEDQIYHATGQLKANKEKILLIDWTEIAIEEKDTIFLKVASSKKPIYFEVKKEL